MQNTSFTLSPGVYKIDGPLITEYKTSGLQNTTLRLQDPEAWQSIFGGTDKITTRQAYQVVSMIYACTRIRAGAIATMPWEITTPGGEIIWDYRKSTPPPKLDFLSNFSYLLNQTEASLTLSGAAYMAKPLSLGRRRPLVWWSPNYVSIFPDLQAGEIAYFNHSSPNNAVMEQLKPRDVLYIFSPDPFVELGPGTSPGKATLQNADILESLQTFLDNYLDKGLVRSVMLTVEGAKPKERERERILAWWRKIAGKSHAGETEIFSSHVNPHVIGEGLKDLDDTDLTQEQWQAISTGMGVPHSLVMSSGTGNRAVSESDQLNFYLFTVVPESKVIETGWNEGLFGEMKMNFRFRPDKLEIMQKYEVTKAQQLMQLTGKPVMTVNEAREMLGLDPHKDPQADELSFERSNEVTRLDDPFSNDSRAEDNANRDRVNEAVRALKQVELDNYRKKVEKTGNRALVWTPINLDKEEVEIINTRLKGNYTLTEAFEPPFI